MSSRSGIVIRNSKISKPILAFRPMPITARFFEVLNKTWMSVCSDINQSTLFSVWSMLMGIRWMRSVIVTAQKCRIILYRLE